MAPPIYLINTISFITNLIKEGKVVEANTILDLNINQLEKLVDQTESEIGQHIAADLREFESLSGDKKSKRNHFCNRWRNFRVRYVLHFLLIISVCYHN